jgi:hypothetical protein
MVLDGEPSSELGAGRNIGVAGDPGAALGAPIAPAREQRGSSSLRRRGKVCVSRIVPPHQSEGVASALTGDPPGDDGGEGRVCSACASPRLLALRL